MAGGVPMELHSSDVPIRTGVGTNRRESSKTPRASFVGRAASTARTRAHGAPGGRRSKPASCFWWAASTAHTLENQSVRHPVLRVAKQQGLLRQDDVEGDLDGVFDLYRTAGEADGGDAEVALRHGGGAQVMAVLEVHVDRDRVGLAVQGEVAADGPMIGARVLGRNGLEGDFRKADGVEDHGTLHGGLDFGAVVG